MQSGKSTVFSLYQMASTSKAFKIVCGSASSLLTPDDTHNLCVFCLGKEHARDVLEGNLRALELFLCKKKLRSRPVPLFEERGASVCFPRFGTHRCRGTEVNEISSWMWPMSERGTAPFRARRPRTRVSCWIVTMRSF